MSENSAVRTQTQDEHAGLVRALSQEITNAIAAIEKNDLRQFQATIAKQERICHELVVRKWSPFAAAATDSDRCATRIVPWRRSIAFTPA